MEFVRRNKRFKHAYTRVSTLVRTTETPSILRKHLNINYSRNAYHSLNEPMIMCKHGMLIKPVQEVSSMKGAFFFLQHNRFLV